MWMTYLPSEKPQGRAEGLVLYSCARDVFMQGTLSTGEPLKVGGFKSPLILPSLQKGTFGSIAWQMSADSKTTMSG